ncbi:hypothetical protein Tcan_04111 [Toxocara canis]|uniref:Uncharacterized protein n=2 Tax=Toxocara canis TaxID=6265 RepID=A0A0B2VLU7_TOXCA|nr:hypothetical protein Tcan_04111 [Toxocara canis]VDM28157.1 unnamed protein product [Toxocara canis]
MSPQQSTFRHAVSFSYGPSSPASVPHTAGQNNGYHTPQQGPHFFLPSTPKSCQSTPTLGASYRRRYAGNRPRSVVLFPPNTSQPPPPLAHPKMNLSQSSPIMAHIPLQQLPHLPLSYQSAQHSKKIIRGVMQTQQQQHHRPPSESRGGSPVNCFAGAKFSESPKAQLIPLPPTQWLTDAGCEGSSCGRALPLAPSPELDDGAECHQHQSASTPQRSCRAVPVRMNPLQLIAAVAAS